MREPEGGGDVVLVTGTTGNLGCYLLDALVSSGEVRLVYGLNRASRDGVSLVERQKEALRHRGLDARILQSPKVVLLEGSLTDPAWGLSAEMYEQVRVCDLCVRWHTHQGPRAGASVHDTHHPQWYIQCCIAGVSRLKYSARG